MDSFVQFHQHVSQSAIIPTPLEYRYLHLVFSIRLLAIKAVAIKLLLPASSGISRLGTNALLDKYPFTSSASALTVSSLSLNTTKSSLQYSGLLSGEEYLVNYCSGRHACTGRSYVSDWSLQVIIHAPHTAPFIYNPQLTRLDPGE